MEIWASGWEVSWAVLLYTEERQHPHPPAEDAGRWGTPFSSSWSPLRGPFPNFSGCGPIIAAADSSRSCPYVDFSGSFAAWVAQGSGDALQFREEALQKISVGAYAGSLQFLLDPLLFAFKVNAA